MANNKTTKIVEGHDFVFTAEDGQIWNDFKKLLKRLKSCEFKNEDLEERIIDTAESLEIMRDAITMEKLNSMQCKQDWKAVTDILRNYIQEYGPIRLSNLCIDADCLINLDTLNEYNQPSVIAVFPTD